MGDQEKEQHAESSDDESDEDFCPEKETAFAGESVSEEDSDSELEEEDHKAKPTKQRKKPQTKKIKKRASKCDEKERNEQEEEEETIRRSTRQTEDGRGKLSSTRVVNELESDEDEKSRSDSLWADFLGDVNPAASKKSASPAICSASSTAATPTSNGAESIKAVTPPAEASPKLITVTETLDFAGEDIRVTKTVSANSIKENKTAERQAAAVCGGARGLIPGGLKRSGAPGGSGLVSILNQIGKKKKISVLEKTKLDWKSFKKDEGIEEELQTFNKGKDGFLERQDFLQRTDLRQFEIEKNLRQSRRN